MVQCVTCNAGFGIKFDKITCSGCKKGFCSGHAVEYKYVTMSPNLPVDVKSGTGFCYDCILNFWGKGKEFFEAPNGVVGRTSNLLNNAVSWIKKTTGTESSGQKLLMLNDDHFVEINKKRSYAIFRNQKDIDLDVDVDKQLLINDLIVFARMYAINQGRHNELEISLNDIYSLMEWFKNHSALPDWAHGISWNTMKSSPIGLSYASDIWHLTSTAVKFTYSTNPVSALYNIANLTSEQVTGKSVSNHAYKLIKNPLGLNVNPKAAIVSYFAGLCIMQLYKQSSNQSD